MKPLFEYTELGNIKWDFTVGKGKFAKHILQNIISFDIECSNGYYDGDVVHEVKYSCAGKNTENDNYEPMSLMYCWQASVERRFPFSEPLVFMGRTYEDFYDFLERLEACVTYQLSTNTLAGNFDTDLIKKSYGARIPRSEIFIYIHNLSYEFQHLRNIFNTKFSVFARQYRKPMKASVPFHFTTLTFKDTLVLTQKTLKNWAKDAKLPVQKLEEPKGFYDAIRTPITPLTDNEIEYCINDVLVIHYGISQYRDRFGTLEEIPMTQTGIIRSECRNIAYLSPEWSAKCAEITASYDFNTYSDLIDIYLGGYTHASARYADRVIKNCKCFDFASSYPYVMTTKKFPVTEFIETTNYQYYLEQMPLYDTEPWKIHHFFYVDVTFKNVRLRRNNTFWSSSKVRKDYDGKKVKYQHLDDAIVDNGRIFYASYMRTKMTDLDLAIFLKDYDCEMTINSMRVSEAGYLDKELVALILQHYSDKTALKGIDERVSEYVENKQFINSIYGVMVTKLICDEIVFNGSSKIFKDECNDFENGLSDAWERIELTEEKYIEEMSKIAESNDQFACYQHGCWVTAWARFNLWTLVLQLDRHVVYCDTDSIKGPFSNRDLKRIRQYNNRVLKEQHEASDYMNLDISLWQPRDIHGNKRPIGLFEQESPCFEFKTLGAKRYVDTVWDNKNQKIKLCTTIAGLPKASGPKILNKVDDFTNHTVWCSYMSEKLMSMYNDDQSKALWIDRNGVQYTSDDKFGICLKPVQFDLSMTTEYETLIDCMDYSNDWEMPEEYTTICSIFQREVNFAKAN